MITRIRKLYNAIDGLFDRAAITRTIHISRDLREPGIRKTARAAFESILPAAEKYDRKAQLKRIVSTSGIDERGTSAHWEFFFDLPGRQAQAICEWKLTWDEKIDAHGPPVMEVTVRPFPPAESPLRRMVRDGNLLYRQLKGYWSEELRRLPPLPLKFRDTLLLPADFEKQGLDITQMEFTLSTGHSPERRVSWMAQTRDKTYLAAFS
jgi:hypothetical protein